MFTFVGKKDKEFAKKLMGLYIQKNLLDTEHKKMREQWIEVRKSVEGNEELIATTTYAYGHMDIEYWKSYFKICSEIDNLIRGL